LHNASKMYDIKTVDRTICAMVTIVNIVKIVTMFTIVTIAQMVLIG
jgi:hypothetical protein